MVNQRPLYRADWELNLRTLYDVGPAGATREQKTKVLEDMIREELFVQRGVELDEASVDPDVRSALISAVEQQVAFDALSRKPQNDELKRFYDKNRARYQTEGTMIVHDYLAPSALAGEKAIKAIRAGQPAEKVIGQLKLRDTKKTQGEEFYFAAKIHLGDQLFAAATRLAKGEVLQSDRAAGRPTFTIDGIDQSAAAAAVRTRSSAVAKDLIDEATARLNAGNEKFLRRRANVLIADDLK